MSTIFEPVLRPAFSLEDRYFKRMAGSLKDKIKIVENLPPIHSSTVPPRVLDVGAGGGEFSNSLSSLGYEVTALDASEESIQRIENQYPNLKAVQLLANQVSQKWSNYFDAIVCSSVLHEVFSYGDDELGVGEYRTLPKTLTSFYAALKPGGRLIIRDGVLPENWEERGLLTLLEGHDESSIYKYLRMCPFSNGIAGKGETGKLVQLTKIGPKTFEGNVRSLLEFSYTYTWGLDSYHRETQELYAVHTLREYNQLLTETGFEIVSSHSDQQPGYPKNLKKKVHLQVGNKKDQWFDSNAIWVAAKPN